LDCRQRRIGDVGFCIDELDRCVRLAARRFDIDAGWTDLGKFVGGAFLVLVALVLAALGALGFLKSFLDAHLNAQDASLVGVTALLGTVGFRQSDGAFFGSPFDIDLKKHVRDPKYEENLAKRERMLDDISTIIEVYTGTADRVCVFIDDLDRADGLVAFARGKRRASEAPSRARRAWAWKACRRPASALAGWHPRGDDADCSRRSRPKALEWRVVRVISDDPDCSAHAAEATGE
jgi:hypothetical protein